jgi:hypothetical protein
MKPAPLFFASIGNTAEGSTGSGPAVSRSAAAPARPATPEEAKRSHALDLACAHALDLARFLREMAASDQARPLRQKDRHLVKTRVAEKLRQIEARIAEATT